LKLKKLNNIREKRIKKNVGPVKENGVWIVHINQELMGLSIEPDIISQIRKRRLR
jgi:regulator of PEP synthase PpsR (kinase-PPPase family)